jgi:hypothetical protein
VPATGLLVACLAVAVVVPVLFFPLSKTIWLAIDLRFRPAGPDEVTDGYGR